MTRFVYRPWVRRVFLASVWIVVAIFISLIVIRQYLDWSGARRWAAVQAMLAREGESIDFRKTAPDPVPDDQNFCAIPLLKDLAVIPEDDAKSVQGLNRMRLMDAALPRSHGPLVDTGKILNSLVSGHVLTQNLDKDYVPEPKLLRGARYGTAIDMTAWANWLRKDGSPPISGNPAKDVLAALSRNDTLVSELAAGLNRPDSQWTPSWKTRDLPDDLYPIPIRFTAYNVVHALTPMLCLRCAAAARAGDPAKAHQSLLIAVRMDQGFMKDPFVIGNLESSGISAIICGAVWELCDAHSGTAEDFRTLQQALLRLDFQKSLLFAERGEITFAGHASTYLKRTRMLPFLTPLSTRDPNKGGWTPFAFSLIPDGWFDENCATLVQWHYDYFVQPLRDGSFRELLAKQKELDAIVAEHNSRLPYAHLDEILALIAMPAFKGVTYRVIYTQTIVNEAIAACALERYRIEHNTYPDTLEAANHPGETPIPLDVISGKPMGYRNTLDGKYVLWCVGFSEIDHGGTRVPNTTRFDNPEYRGDWVWDFPAK